MPGADPLDEREHSIDSRDRERGERDRERGPKSKSSSSKSKDLSHVPCKFFKVGSCTAGASCPFSHNVPEPGQHKEVCTWFVKGNCKFGHKCALAHILPGQPMAMDRKNKKAAQAASKNGGGGGGGAEKSGSGRMNKTTSSSSAHGNNRGDADDGHAAQTNSGGRSSGSLLSGSTAPTRVLTGPSSRAPMPMSLKATISPSAPAPPLKDTDFASFGLPDESNKLPNAPAAISRASQSPVADKRPSIVEPEPNANEDDAAVTGDLDEERERTSKSSPSPLPFNTPRPPRTSSHQPDSGDLGPIGSPPRSLIGSPPLSHASRSQLNGLSAVDGFSPGTSPRMQPTVHSSVPANAFLTSGSPFGNAGQGMFYTEGGQGQQQGSGLGVPGAGGRGVGEEDDFRTRSGLAASLGASRNWRSDLSMTSTNPPPSAPATSTRHPYNVTLGDTAVVDEDLEEFIPSSLTDLLTPEERSRRYSRTGGGPPTASGAWTQNPANRPSVETHHHRYSRSVPAPSLLGDIKSIWSDNQPNPANLSSSPANPSFLQPSNSGLPGSYKSGFMGGVDNGLSPSQSGNGLPMSMSPSSNFLSPSNASAAFLPSIHQHHQQFLATKRSTSSTASGLRPLTSTNSGSSTPAINGHIDTPNSSSANAAQLLARLTGADGGISSSPPPSSASFHQSFRPPGLAQSVSNASINLNDEYRAPLSHLNPSHQHQGGPPPSAFNPSHHHHHHPQPNQQHVAPAMALSPSSRALQAHAPGQSLPQGLAAGYSRIHALPPPPSVGNLPSPSMFGSMSTAQGLNAAGAGAGQSLSDWIGMSPGAAAANGHSIRASPRAGAVALPGMGGRQVSGGGPGRSWAGVVGGGGGGRGVGGDAGGTLSPLSGPVVSAAGGDDDDLFVLDG